LHLRKLLLKHGAGPNVKDYKGLMPLHYAVMRGRLDAAEILLHYGADPTASDSEGKNANSHEHVDVAVHYLGTRHVEPLLV